MGFLAASWMPVVSAANTTLPDVTPSISKNHRAAEHANVNLILLILSILAFVVLAVLHNVCEGVADQLASVRVLQLALQIVAVTTFLIALFFGPPAILIGLVGSVGMFFRNRRRARRPDATVSDPHRQDSTA